MIKASVRQFVWLAFVAQFSCGPLSGLSDYHASGGPSGGSGASANGGGGAGGSPASDWLEGWGTRRTVDVHSNLLGNVSDFQLPILIAEDADLGANTLAAGLDLRFTADDGITVLPFDIEHVDDSGRLVAWVRLDIDPAQAPQRVYLYYGEPSATAGASGVETWAGYDAVWHKAHDPSVGETADDSSGQGHDGGMPQGTPASTAGVAGDGIDFGGNSSYPVQAAEPLDYATSSFTLSMWAKRVTGQGALQLPLFNGGTAGGGAAGFSILVGVNYNWSFWYTDGVNYAQPQWGGLNALGASWHHIVAVVDRDAEEVVLFLDGNPSDSTSIAGYGPVDNGSQNVSFGLPNFPFFGSVDEVRFRASASSPARVMADYVAIVDHEDVVVVGPPAQR
jgi:biopolymer transport protein ExbB